MLRHNVKAPNNIKVSINGDPCSLPELNQINTGITPWRNNVPIDITQHTYLRSSLQNNITITWSLEPCVYMASVYIAQKLTSADLLVELEKRPKRTSDKTKELIKESMENDDDMIVDFLFVPIKNPLTKLRMKLTAQGIDCVHLQCFVAQQFLQLN